MCLPVIFASQRGAFERGKVMERSRQSRTLVSIGLFVTVCFFTVQLGLGPTAEAAPKSEPVAVVGPDFQVLVGETVTANGSLSYDPSGKKLQFMWELIEVPPGSTAKLLKRNSPKPSFTADKHGRYIIELQVSNNGIKWSDMVRLTVTTAYPENALVPVDTRLVSNFHSIYPTYSYSMDIGGTYYAAPPYKSGTGTSAATGFQVLVLDRATLLPAVSLPSTYNQSFSGTAQGYSDMTTFLGSLTDPSLLVIISSLYINELDNFPDQKSSLAAQIQRLGGTENFTWLGKDPTYVYTLIGIPGVGAGNGFEMCGWDHYGIVYTATIQGLLTKDKYGNFQFIYPNFTAFETKSFADSGGNFSGSVIMGSVEIAAPIPGGNLPPGQGAFQVVYFRRDNADWGSAPPSTSVYLTNVPGQEAQSVKNMAALLKGLTSSNSNGFGYPAPDSYMVIIQSIGVPFGVTSLYDQQSIKDLEKLINNLGGTESTFHAIFNNPGTAASPNKYSLLGIAVDDVFVNMRTMPRLGPTESVESSTLKLQEDGSWTVFNSDGNVRGVINKNNRGMYVPFLASEGVANVDLSLPIILFQDPTPWITGPVGKDSTPYMAAYSWISSYITGAPPQNGTCSTPGAAILKGGKCGDLRTYYPTIDNIWSSVVNILYSTGDMDTQVNKFCQSATGNGTDFNCDQYVWMKNQLHSEVSKVQVAQILFQDDILGFFTDLALTQSFSLSAFYTNAYGTLGIDPVHTNTTQSILDMVHAVAKQVQIMGLAKAKPVVAVMGGIVSAGLAIASHFIPDQTTDPVGGVITTTIQDLWQDLSNNYLTEDFVARKSYELVVSDWGKLQAAENLWKKWDENSRDDALAAMTVGFEAYLYKVLIPAATYIVEPMPGTQYSKPADFQTCQKTVIKPITCDYYGHHWDIPVPNYVTVASQAWDPLQARQAHDIYSVYKGNVAVGKISYLPAQTLNNIFAPSDFYDLTKLGVSKIDFFTRWPFTYTVWVGYDEWCYTCGHLW